MEGKRVNDSRVVMSQMMSPQDANVAGNVHGGVIMKLIDTAAGVVAIRHARSNVVTASIDRLDFHHPTFVGDLLTLRASLNFVGRTSMEVGVRVETENLISGLAVGADRFDREERELHFLSVAARKVAQPSPHSARRMCNHRSPTRPIPCVALLVVHITPLDMQVHSVFVCKQNGHALRCGSHLYNSPKLWGVRIGSAQYSAILCRYVRRNVLRIFLGARLCGSSLYFRTSSSLINSALPTMPENMNSQRSIQGTYILHSPTSHFLATSTSQAAIGPGVNCRSRFGMCFR